MLRESVSVLIIGRVPLLKHSTPFFDNLILLSGAIPSCCVNGIVFAKREFGICAVWAGSLMVKQEPPKLLDMGSNPIQPARLAPVRMLDCPRENGGHLFRKAERIGA